MEDLFEYISRGDITSIERVVREFPGSAGIQNPDSMTPLLFAAYHGKTEAAKAIFSAQFPFTIHERAVMDDVDGLRTMINQDAGSVDSYSGDGWTPLHLAAFFGRTSVVRILLSKGAKVDAASRSKASFGNSPLQAAVEMGRTGVAKILLDNGANATSSRNPAGLHPYTLRLPGKTWILYVSS